MEQKTQSTLRLNRMESLCDGVFAIAMTLLILEIQVPIKELIHSESDLLHAILNLAPKFFSYLLSFLILGIFWVGHNGQYAFIKNIDRELLWINVLFLLFVSIIPFSTALLGEFILYKWAVWFYWLNLLLIGFSLLFNWVYAKRKGFIPALDEKPEIHRTVKRRILFAQVFYAAGAIAAFINTHLLFSNRT